MLSRVLKVVLSPLLLVIVTALVFIGLANSNLLFVVISKLIVAIVIIGIPILIVKRLFSPN